MSHPILPSMAQNVRLVMAGIPEPENWTPLPPREPDVRPTLPLAQPERRDAIRNQCLAGMAQDIYDKSQPSLESQSFFRGINLLERTFKHEGMELFPQIESSAVMRSCEAFYRPDGWMLLWSTEHGTGKTTFALWHILRHLRLLSERLADADDGCFAHFRACDYCPPTVAFESWPIKMAETKRQIGTRGVEDTLARLKAAEILVIEDIGPMSEYELKLFEDLLGSRYARQQRTILCSRAVDGLEDLEKRVIGARVFGMLRQRGCTVFVDGPSFRTQLPRSTVTTPF